MKTFKTIIATLTVLTLLLYPTGRVQAQSEGNNKVPESVQKWVNEGHYVDFEGLQIFVHTSHWPSIEAPEIIAEVINHVLPSE